MVMDSTIGPTVATTKVISSKVSDKAKEFGKNHQETAISTKESTCRTKNQGMESSHGRWVMHTREIT